MPDSWYGQTRLTGDTISTYKRVVTPAGRVCYQKDGRFVTRASVPPDIIVSLGPALPSPYFSPPAALEPSSMSVNEDLSSPPTGSSATNNASTNPLLSAASSAASALCTQNETQPSVALPPTMPPFVASPVSQTKADDAEGGLDAFNARASTNKDYLSLSALIWPLTLYFRILIQFAISGGQMGVVAALTDGFLEYLDHLHEINMQYKWGMVLQYHMDYHSLR
ncbi:hypothetical protein L218DRAFT_1000297 [Marasmius fiardii PR-910]|nr:hypothetical protein L218DRAFT_1000297 [Marasmius fiardii PR-910]